MPVVPDRGEQGELANAARGLKRVEPFPRQLWPKVPIVFGINPERRHSCGLAIIRKKPQQCRLRARILRMRFGTTTAATREIDGRLNTCRFRRGDRDGRRAAVGLPYDHCFAFVHVGALAQRVKHGERLHHRRVEARRIVFALTRARVLDIVTPRRAVADPDWHRDNKAQTGKPARSRSVGACAQGSAINRRT